MPDVHAPRASGTLESHYAPHTPVALISSDCLEAAIAALNARGRRIALIHHTSRSAAVAASRAMQEDAGDYAHDLYAALRSMDHANADVILVEAPPAAPAWSGVNDRLQRAAHDSAGILQKLLQD
jgi:L-threonylcarbamoyladenylate synthase